MDTGSQKRAGKPFQTAALCRGISLLRACCLILAALLAFPLPPIAHAADQIVNIYTWSQEIPARVFLQFERETGIHVNHASYDSNEIMYAKLRTNRKNVDLIEPSSYYVERMRKLGMLERLDTHRLPSLKHLDPFFARQGYDPGNHYSVPLLWGATGIFTNRNWFAPDHITHWHDLAHPRFKNQLMILDDPREAFSMALLMLGYSVNDTHPPHLQAAWHCLQRLMPNIRLFNADAIKSILIDEDAVAGMAWNGDLATSQQENPQLAFVFPGEGFEIWVDSLALLKTAPHRNNAYYLLNFLLRPDIARIIAFHTGYATANLTARKTLPAHLRNNPTLYPPEPVLKKGEFQRDVGDATFALYEKYWEKLKTGTLG